MKIKILIALILNPIFCGITLGQNITNTLGTNGLFTIKNGSTAYFSLSQSTGNIDVLRSINLANTTYPDTNSGVIRKNGIRFMHNFQRSTDAGNTFLGLLSGNFLLQSTAAFNTGVGQSVLRNLTDGSNNSAFGYNSLLVCATGSCNSAFGTQSLSSLTNGSYNTAFGYQSLFVNTGSGNTAIGSGSLAVNTIGTNNNAFGFMSLFNNVSGAGNCAFGTYSISSNVTGSTSGSDNCAFGNYSLPDLTTGIGNTAIGSLSGRQTSTYNYSVSLGNYTINKGDYGIAIGYSAVSNGTNAIALGYNASAGSTGIAIGYNSGTFGTNTIAIGINNFVSGNNGIAIGNNLNIAANQIKLGNSTITSAQVQVAWTITSDRKFKTGINNSPLGLSFISKLRPVSYTRINDESMTKEYGFIAQEVDEVLKESGAENTGMITVDTEGTYNMRYNDLLAPMVKAIQELKEGNEKLANENAALKQRLEKIESKLSGLSEK